MTTSTSAPHPNKLCFVYCGPKKCDCMISKVAAERRSTFGTQIGILVLLGLFGLPAFMAYKTYEPAPMLPSEPTVVMEKKDPSAYAQPACTYEIRQAGVELIPYDWVTGQRVGVFGRHPDGSVQLTVSKGVARHTEECISAAGFGDLIPSIDVAK